MQMQLDALDAPDAFYPHPVLLNSVCFVTLWPNM